jgi:putative ABC transport system permease protein
VCESHGADPVVSALVFAELAIALVLLAGAATIARTVGSLMRADIGVRGERVLAMETTLPRAKYGSLDAVVAFHEQLEARVLAIPGVERAGSTNFMPGSSEIGVSFAFRFERHEAPVRGSYLSATPGYFEAIGIDLLAGRFFTDNDGGRSAPVAIISESLAARTGLTPADAVGRRVRVGFDNRWASILGVVRDVRLRGPESEASAQLYVPVAQEFDAGTTFLVARSRLSAAAAERTVQSCGQANLYNLVILWALFQGKRFGWEPTRGGSVPRDAAGQDSVAAAGRGRSQQGVLRLI